MSLLAPFDGYRIIRDHVHRARREGAFPEACRAVLSEEDFDAAWREITGWPGYAPTPLRDLSQLADALAVDRILYKDEAGRFGLGSFKSLGGAYAVLEVVADRIEAATGSRPALEDLRAGRHANRAGRITVTTATDGNHGRAVAWGAGMTGARCVIHIHAGVSEGRQRAMEALGAEVRRMEGDYDASVRRCVQEAAAQGWAVVSDTSFPGYVEVPRRIMAGYGVLAREIVDAVERPPTHVFVQAGVGGIAAALLARLWIAWGARLPRFVVVEPARAACVLASARNDASTAVEIRDESIMAGLSCGEPSLLAWEILSRGAGDFLAIGEAGVEEAMRLLAAGRAGGGPITAGESAVPGLLALAGAAQHDGWRARLGLDETSRVLLLGCEGATDPEIYDRIVSGIDG